MPCFEIFRKYFIVTVRIIGIKYDLIFLKILMGPSLIIRVLPKKATIRVKGKLVPFRSCFLLHHEDLWKIRELLVFVCVCDFSPILSEVVNVTSGEFDCQETNPSSFG